jgi:hypothetical protein
MFHRKYEQKFQFSRKIPMSASLPSQGTKNAATVSRTRWDAILLTFLIRQWINWKQSLAKKIPDPELAPGSASATKQQSVTEIPYRNRLFLTLLLSAHPVDDPAVHVTVRPPVDCILQPTYR